jgi:hypothetical protein
MVERVRKRCETMSEDFEVCGWGAELQIFSQGIFSFTSVEPQGNENITLCPPLSLLSVQQ